jgi:hypothetical protein
MWHPPSIESQRNLSFSRPSFISPCSLIPLVRSQRTTVALYRLQQAHFRQARQRPRTILTKDSSARLLRLPIIMGISPLPKWINRCNNSNSIKKSGKLIMRVTWARIHLRVFSNNSRMTRRKSQINSNSFLINTCKRRNRGSQEILSQLKIL